MSIPALAWLDRQPKTLSDQEHRVLYEICRKHAAEKGDMVVVQYDDLARACGTFEDNVQATLLALDAQMIVRLSMADDGRQAVHLGGIRG